MQTAKIKLGQTYALKREGVLVRFFVTEMVTKKNSGGTTNHIVGYVVEDRIKGITNADGTTDRTIDPERLIGPYEEQAELVERRKQEAAESVAKAAVAKQEAEADRLALYRFVGVEPITSKVDAYDQLFRVTGSNYVDPNREGTKAIIARVIEINAMTDEAERTNVVLPFRG